MLEGRRKRCRDGRRRWWFSCFDEGGNSDSYTLSANGDLVSSSTMMLASSGERDVGRKKCREGKQKEDDVLSLMF
jgi:hypothetical protein